MCLPSLYVRAQGKSSRRAWSRLKAEERKNFAKFKPLKIVLKKVQFKTSTKTTVDLKFGSVKNCVLAQILTEK